jgi:hypothetical protein
MDAIPSHLSELWQKQPANSSPSAHRPPSTSGLASRT